MKTYLIAWLLISACAGILWAWVGMRLRSRSMARRHAIRARRLRLRRDTA